MKNLWTILGCALILSGLMTFTARAREKAPDKTTAFVNFDRRAKAGERLNVVFFGASLTWGANSSNPIQTSYRADVARRFEAYYPRAHFRFFDGAIGGTGSQLGVFRLQSDVLNHHPDLVFLDFSANDDITSADAQTLASYESLVRRIIIEGRCPVVQMIFPFRWNIAAGALQKMPRRDAHLAIARAYGNPTGDAIALVTARAKNGADDFDRAYLDKIWPIDGIHPGDTGYAVFAEAAWQGYLDGVTKKMVSAAPPAMLYAPTYMTWNRARLSALQPLPAGWRVGIPNRTSAYFDFLMSRWLDDEIIASNRQLKADGKMSDEPQTVAPLRIKFRGTMVMLLGECTLESGKYRAILDGKLVERAQNGQTPSEYDPGAFARTIGGNGHHVQIIATDLDAAVEHTLEIEPIFDKNSAQELRLESVCVAGGAATVERDWKAGAA